MAPFLASEMANATFIKTILVYYVRKTIPDIIVIEYLQTYDLCVEKWKSLTFYLLLFFSSRLSEDLS